MPGSSPTTFDSFGELLKYLRRRSQLTQKELGIAVGYSDAQIARLENGTRLPDLVAVKTVFAEALDLQNEPELMKHLVRLAYTACGEQPAAETNLELTRPGLVGPYRTVGLPAQLTPFVGRKRELAEIVHLLGDKRLITLTGTGGVGKTRLALEVGATLVKTTQRLRDRDLVRPPALAAHPPTFPDGVWLAELAPLADAGPLIHTVAAVFGLQTMSRPALNVLTDYLADRSLLLLLDNCEHLIGACAELVEALLRACPRLCVLATSREGLNIPGEVTWRVPSLAPDDGVRLFADRAHDAKPDLALTPTDTAYITHICQRLDNMPLALELAAAHVNTLMLPQLAARLDHSFHLLTGGSRVALPRQQTLRATIDWSYHLLTTAERGLLQELSVFAGGWTLEAAEAVHGHSVLELLDQLVSKSLVLADERPAGMRYRLLETIRQYAREKFAEADKDMEREARQRHLDYFANLAGRARSYIAEGPEPEVWIAVLMTELDNLRAALSWAALKGDWQAGERLINGISIWPERGYGGELANWIARVLLSNPQVSGSVRAVALQTMGWLAVAKGDMAGSIGWFREASLLAHQLEDTELLLSVDSSLGLVTPDYLQATTLLSHVIQEAHRAGLKVREIGAMGWLGLRMRLNGDYAQAAEVLTKAVTLAKEADKPIGAGQSLRWLGQMFLERGDFAQACQVLEESIVVLRRFGTTNSLVVALTDLGTARLYQGDHASAREALHESIPYWYRVDNLERLAQGLVLAAGLAQALGQLDPAARLLGVAAGIRRDHHSHGVFERELFAEYDRRLPAVRDAMNSADFDLAWGKGQKLTIHEAMAEALAI